MTRRLTIVLDESVTESGCGSCSFMDGGWCREFDAWTESPARTGYAGGKRLPECLEAERAAARMVEIDPDVAGRFGQHMGGQGGPDWPALDTVLHVLREHARKAGR